MGADMISRTGVVRSSAAGTHYWIVDPSNKTLECYKLEQAGYVTVLRAESPSRVTHPDWPGLTIDLAAIWR